jgi:transposase
MLGNIQRKFSLGRTIVVANKGMTTGDNIWYTLSAKNGYILSYSIRGANQAFKAYVLDEKGYRSLGDDFKIKSRLEPREIRVTSKSGKKVKKVINEKQVIFYSRKYAMKAKADRAAALEKAQDLVKNPSKYHKTNAYGASKYVKNLTFDKQTGEVLTSANQALFFDEDKLRKEEALDGYYAIMTSEYQATDEHIVDIYRGLWKIEESFKVTKRDLASRPIFLSREEHIEAHFLTCFISLVIARILEKQLKGNYSITKILESLKKASCSHIKENYYLLDYFDDVLSDIHKELGIDLGQKCLSLKEIKKILGDVKKG